MHFNALQCTSMHFNTLQYTSIHFHILLSSNTPSLYFFVSPNLTQVRDNQNIFTFELSKKHLAQIQRVLRKSNPIPGGCGDEYRRPPYLTASGDLSDHLTVSGVCFVFCVCFTFCSLPLQPLSGHRFELFLLLVFYFWVYCSDLVPMFTVLEPLSSPVQ